MRQRRLATRSVSTASGSVHGRLAALEQMIADQQRHIIAQEEEIAQQRVRLAEQAQEITSLREALPTAEAPQQVLPESDTPATPARHTGVTSRRSLLRLGGAGVAAGVVVAAGSMYGHVPVAHAAGGSGDGTAIVQGAANVNTSETGTILNAAASSSPAALLTADNSSSTSTDETVTSGVTAIGPGDTNGIIAIGNGTAGFGVWGLSDAGYGVVGASNTGIDLGVFGTGRIQQRLQPSAGAPSNGSYVTGEQVRDSNGDLWLCIADGAPGTWVRVVYAQPSYTGGAINLLSAPIRIFDSRSGTPAPLPASKHILAADSTTTIQVTGTTVGGLKVPSGARAVVGNLTLTNPQGGGDLILYPHGVTRPLTSNSNYAKGQTVANFAIVALSAGGAMDLYVHGASTDVLFDVAGFIM